jgi:hypothetical protein
MPKAINMKPLEAFLTEDIGADELAGYIDSVLEEYLVQVLGENGGDFMPIRAKYVYYLIRLRRVLLDMKANK